MSADTIVSILNIAFVGLTFLLVLMAYRLLKVELEREDVRKRAILAISMFMFLVFGITVLNLFYELYRPELTQVAMSPKREGYDSVGSALYNLEIKRKTANPLECEILCRENDTCKSWSFIGQEYPGEEKNTCYLKGKFEEFRVDGKIHSGCKYDDSKSGQMCLDEMNTN